MKKRNFAVVICSAISIAVAAWSHFATAGNPPLVGPRGTSINNTEIDPAPATAGGNPGINYSTGFEPGEGFPLGYISNTPGTYPAGCGGVAFPCWGHTSAANASLITPTIENLHPASGLQHLRLTHDPTTRTNITGFGLGVDARYPRTSDLSARPVAPNTVSVDIAISNPGGMSFRVQAQSNSQGLIATSMLFFYTGAIYNIWAHCENDSIVPTGFYWDTTGAYQNYTVTMDPCPPTEQARGGYGNVGGLTFYYAGNEVFSSYCLFGYNLEQLLIFGDNYPGSTLDVDNVVLTSLNECPHTCGNGIHEFWADEQCDGAVDANCPGRCIAPGQPGECTCSAICTLENPCVLTNGENGPFLPPCDPEYGCIFTYESVVEAVSIETCGSSFNTKIVYWGDIFGLSGVSNDDCCGPGGPNEDYCAGSDPSASCYDDLDHDESCTCYDIPNYIYTAFLAQILTTNDQLPPPGASIMITISKKATCGGAHLGACCDTNGADQGCTENLAESDCTGADKIWTDQGKCVGVMCGCIADCTGRVCSDDGCGGSCGSCDDGIACTVDVCNAGTSCSHTPDSVACSNHNVCDGIESCNPDTGCVPGLPLVCDDGVFCNGAELCNPISGCVGGNAPCAEDEICDEDSDQCIPNTIPTVSQWGLLVLTIVLLVAGKVRFGRAERAS